MPKALRDLHPKDPCQGEWAGGSRAGVLRAGMDAGKGLQEGQSCLSFVAVEVQPLPTGKGRR